MIVFIIFQKVTEGPENLLHTRHLVRHLPKEIFREFLPCGWPLKLGSFLEAENTVAAQRYLSLVEESV